MKLNEAMSVAKAKEIFDISDIPNEKDLKDLYKTLVKKNHPDLGGSTEAMSLINSAMDTLEPLAKKGGTSKIAWDEIKRKNTERNEVFFIQMETLFSDSFDPEALLNYLSRFTEDELFISVDVIDRKSISKKDWETYSGYFNYSAEVEVYNADRTTVFYVHYWISPRIPDSNGLTSPDIDMDEVMFSYAIATDVYHDRRKYKMAQRDYQWRVGKNTLIDYDEVFPSKKLESIFSEDHVKKEFKKKDMELGLRRELPYVSFDKDVYFIYPFGKDEKFYFALIRGTMMRQPYYMFNTIQAIDPKTKKYFYPAYRIKNVKMTLYETEETLVGIVDAVNDLIKEAHKRHLDIVGDSVELIEILQSALSNYFPK